MTNPRGSLIGHRMPASPAPREIIAPDPRRSFSGVMHDFPSPICGWAAHPEYEIHLIQKSTGSVIVGDYVGTFGPGHLSMIGPLLPHDWVSDVSKSSSPIPDRDALVHFTDGWVRDCMLLMPELQRLDGLLKRSTRGLEFTGKTASAAAECLISLIHSSGPARIANMFELLDVLAEAPEGEYLPLAGEWLSTSDDSYANAAAEAGLAYIFDNLTGAISMSTAASLAHMSEPTFSKYFKRGAGMTFSSMVKKLRIAHAQRLLETTDFPTTKVADESGYRNMSNFNRQFLAGSGMTPTEYRKMVIHKTPNAKSGHAEHALRPSIPGQ